MRTYRTKTNSQPHLVCRPCGRVAVQAPERGVALIITLLLLSMIMALSVGMVVAMSSETLIGGYYRNFRGSFYAADSGLNIATENLLNQLQAGIPSGSFANPPISNPNALATNVLTATNSSYGGSTSLNAGDAGQSWQESFKITNSSLTLAPNSPTITSYDTSTTGCSPPDPPCPTGYTYAYDYSITSVGSSQGSETQTVTENGIITMNVTGLAKAYAVNFSYFGAFIDNYNPGTGPLVPGTMTGPMFTNGAWEFMPTTSAYPSPYLFTDPVGQHSTTVDYWNSSVTSYTASTADKYGSGTQLVDPTFKEGLFMGQPAVTLPANTLNQEEAVVDGAGNISTWAPTGAGGLSTLTNVTNSGTAWNSSTSTGVFANQGTTASACGSKTPPCMLGGGFYVQGGADVKLVPVSGSNTAQQYVITQSGTTTTITVDPAANGGVGSTVITQGSATSTLSGVPMNSLLSQAQTEVYVDGNMTIHGPAQGQAAVQDNAMIGITANGNITATADVLYKTEPVTIPQDTLVPATSTNPMNQVLGLFTANGNFVTNTSQRNIEIDASIATISATESGNCSAGKGGQTSVTSINTFNNVGGMIQSCIFPAPITTENTWYDRRFKSRPGFAPPWFPSTQVQQGGALPVNTTPTIQRIQWLNTSAQ